MLVQERHGAIIEIKRRRAESPAPLELRRLAETSRIAVRVLMTTRAARRRLYDAPEVISDHARRVERLKVEDEDG